MNGRGNGKRGSTLFTWGQVTQPTDISLDLIGADPQMLRLIRDLGRPEHT